MRLEWKFFSNRKKEHYESVQKVVNRLKKRNPLKDGFVWTAGKTGVTVGMRNVDYKWAHNFEGTRGLLVVIEVKHLTT